MGKVIDVGKALALVDKAKTEETNPVLHPRYEAWKMRVQGYQVPAIAQELGVTLDRAYKYLAWVREEHSELVIKDFLQLSLERLEMQYMQLERKRKRGDIMAHRVSKEILDMEAKLLGAYTIKVDVSQQINFVVDGIDMSKV